VHRKPPVEVQATSPVRAHERQPRCCLPGRQERGHALEFLTFAGSQEHVGRVGFVLDIRRTSASRAWVNLADEVVSILRFESARERTSALLLKS
jgi:hypothetical protein